VCVCVQTDAQSAGAPLVAKAVREAPGLRVADRQLALCVCVCAGVHQPPSLFVGQCIVSIWWWLVVLGGDNCHRVCRLGSGKNTLGSAQGETHHSPALRERTGTADGAK